MYNNVKSMVEKEPPNYKKSFLFSLMAVLLISSLAVCMCTGQAMGQTENDVEPLSMSRITGSIIVTIGFIILIIALFTKFVRRKTAEIYSSNTIKPLTGLIKAVFLGIFTLFVYLIYFNAERVAKLNVISKHVNESGYMPENKYKPIKFHATSAVIFLTACLFPVIFTFVNGILLNPSAYTAIFNLDGTALFTALGEGFEVIKLLAYNTIGIIAIFGWFFCLFAFLFLGSAVATPNRLKELLTVYVAKYYMENSVEYYSECVYVLKKYENNSIFSNTAGNMQDVYKILIKYHNIEVLIQQTHGRDR